MNATKPTADGNARSGAADTIDHSREKASLVERVRLGLANAEIDCRCRAAAEDLLTRLGREEDLVRRAGALAEARRMRDSIVAVIALLGDLDKLMPEEPDASAFLEMADLFRDIREFAGHGISAAHEAADAPTASVDAEMTR